ncbi:hypothetical protein [Variovorax sp. HJSM1_2]
MIEAATVIEALQAYRKRLIAQDQPAKAAAVQTCIAIVRRVAMVNPK